MKADRAFKIIAWVLLLALAIVTVGPVGLRPMTPLPAQVERGIGLGIIGLAFGLAYPRHIIVFGILLIGATASLEALQTLEPGRHARLLDFLVKAAGGVLGLAIAHFARRRPLAD